MTLFGIGARVVAPFKNETVTGVVEMETYDHETGRHSLNIVTNEPRVSPVTGRQYVSTQVDGTQARSA